MPRTFSQPGVNVYLMPSPLASQLNEGRRVTPRDHSFQRPGRNPQVAGQRLCIKKWAWWCLLHAGAKIADRQVVVTELLRTRLSSRRVRSFDPAELADSKMQKHVVEGNSAE